MWTAILGKLRNFATLPDWLVNATQPERVCRILTRSIPEFSGGEFNIQECVVSRVRMQQDCWVGRYQLTVDEPRGGQQRAVLLRGTIIPPSRVQTAQHDRALGTPHLFGSTEWHCWVPKLSLSLEMQPSDTELLPLRLLTDLEQARALLEESIRSRARTYSDTRIQAYTSEIKRYKPGSSCTILYRLENRDAHAGGYMYPDVVVAKLYNGDKGQCTYEAMCALWNSPLSSSDIVTIAEPLAYLPELKVLFQGAIPQGQTLKDLLRSTLREGTPEAMEEVYHYMRKAAAGLAALHQSGVCPGTTLSWEDELAEVRQVFERLVGLVPQLAGAATPLLTRLAELAAEHPADPPLPTHGSFRPDQVLINNGQIGFIDFDRFCLAEPALDIALFRATIKDIGLNTAPSAAEQELDDPGQEARLARLDAICAVFLAHYTALAPVSWQRIVLWETLAILTDVLHCWTKVKPDRLSNAMLLLEHHLRVCGI